MITINDLTNRSLDDWYIKINSIYLDTNFYRSSASIFTHLVEVIGGLSLLASNKHKKNIEPKDFVSKCFAWWMALCGNLGIKTVSEMLWLKFPNVCPYCFENPHNPNVCRDNKIASSSPNWEKLRAMGNKNRSKIPGKLDDWQKMFTNIYPVGNDGYKKTFSRLTEELGELAESIRIFPLQPSYFLSEASDVFAWLMHLQNIILDRSRDTDNILEPLSIRFAESYPDNCRICKKRVCSCPPILNETLGRIAKENPLGVEEVFQGTSLISASEALKLFEIGSFDITLANEEYRTNSSLIQDIFSIVEEMRLNDKTKNIIAKNSENKLEMILSSIENLSSSQRVTQENVNELVSEIHNLPSDQRTVITDFLGGISSSVWASGIVKAVELLA